MIGGREAHKPPFQFIIIKSILIKIVVGDSVVLPIYAIK